MGIDTELFTSDKDMLYTFVCAICTDVAHPPFLFPCAAGHIFCEECIGKLAICPNDREPSNGKLILHVSGPLLRAYNNLKLACPLHCEWTGALGDLESHFPHCKNSPSLLSSSSSSSSSAPPSPALSPSFPLPSAPPLEQRIPSSVDLIYNDKNLYPDPVKDTSPSAPEIDHEDAEVAVATLSMRRLMHREAAKTTVFQESKFEKKIEIGKKKVEKKTKEEEEKKKKEDSDSEDDSFSRSRTSSEGSEEDTSEEEVSEKKTTTTTKSATSKKIPIHVSLHESPREKHWKVNSGTIYLPGIFNPYVVIRKAGAAGLFSNILKTPVQADTQHPKWNYIKKWKGELQQHYNQYQYIVEMWNYRPFAKDQLIGRAERPYRFGEVQLVDSDNYKIINAVVYIDAPY